MNDRTGFFKRDSKEFDQIVAIRYVSCKNLDPQKRSAQIKNVLKMANNKKAVGRGGGGDQVVSVLVFCSNDSSSNPAEVFIL